MNMKVPPQYAMKHSNLNGYQTILKQIDQTKSPSIFKDNGCTYTEYQDKSGKVILTVKQYDGESNVICEYFGENGNFTQLQDFENDKKLNLMSQRDKDTGVWTKQYDYNQDGTFDESIPETKDGHSKAKFGL